jgi:PAS domain S-box-containing protein
MSVKAMSRLILAGVIMLVLALTGLALVLELPARIVNGVTGHTAIQTLDATRRPFLAMKAAEDRLLHNPHDKTVDEKLSRAIADGRQLLADLLKLAAYEPELEKQVKRLSGLFEVWLGEEQRFFKITRLPRDSAENRVNEILYHQQLTRVSAGFLTTMTALGDAETPIHRTIEDGDAAMRQLLILAALLSVSIIAAVLLLLWQRPRELKIQVTERTAELSKALEQLKREISTRKQQQDKLRIMAMAVANSPTSIIITDSEPLIIYANPAFERISGYSMEEVRGKNPRILRSGKTLPEVYGDLWSTLDAGKEWRGEFVNRRKNGEIYWESASIAPVRDDSGRVNQYVAVKEDITHRKRAEEALQESLEHNRRLFELSPIGLALCRMDGELVDVNPAYAQIIGRTVEDTLHMTYWDITPEKYAEDEQRQLESLNKTGRYGPYEKEYIHKDGHLVAVRLKGMRLEKEGESFIWSSVEDIAERKQADDEIRQNLDKLQKFHRLAVGRELKMIELKKEINELLQDHGRVEKYDISASTMAEQGKS